MDRPGLDDEIKFAGGIFSGSVLEEKMQEQGPESDGGYFFNYATLPQKNQEKIAFKGPDSMGGQEKSWEERQNFTQLGTKEQEAYQISGQGHPETGRYQETGDSQGYAGVRSPEFTRAIRGIRRPEVIKVILGVRRLGLTKGMQSLMSLAVIRDMESIKGTGLPKGMRVIRQHIGKGMDMGKNPEFRPNTTAIMVEGAGLTNAQIAQTGEGRGIQQWLL